MKSDALQDWKEFFQANKKLVIATIVSAFALLALQGYIGGANTECLGIADSKETMVSFEVPVVVKRIFVLPGQVIKKGQPLLEVEPAELNMKLLEVQTELEALRSEMKVRDQLLAGFGKKAAKPGNPIATQVAGLQAQYDELRRQQSNSVRYAEDDGVVATVAFRPREQVHPFVPVITLTSNVPNLVYGFVHEARVSEFNVGDEVIIEPVTAKSRRSTGRVVSVGNRIAPFPERFQTGAQQRPTYFGRELVISLATENQVLIGERVSIRGSNRLRFSDLSFQAFAADPLKQGDLNSQVLAEGLDLEAGGLLEMPTRDSLLVVSDDDGPNMSPFWLFDLKNPGQPKNLTMKGLIEISDVESLTASGGRMYAMSSLTPNKNGKIKPERNLVVRFSLDGDSVVVDRALDLRAPLQEALARQTLLRSISGQLDTAEVEAFAMDGADGYLALKEPQMPDGSSIVLKARGLADQIEAGRIGALDLEVFAMVKLMAPNCENAGRITDIVRIRSGFLVLANCKKSEKSGQIWHLTEMAGQQTATMISSLRGGRPEGLALGADGKTLYVTSDNGNKKGSDFLKLELPKLK
jgi:multidrug efflux pump subunit AcrA (membrane-fusion protein)